MDGFSGFSWARSRCGWPGGAQNKGSHYLTRLGNILAVTGNSWYSPLIAKATGHPVTHVGIFTGNDSVIEALPQVCERSLSAALAEATAAWELDLITLTPVQRARIAAAAGWWLGQGYGWGKIVLHVLDIMFSTARFSNFGYRTRQPTCSYIVADAYAGQGIRFAKGGLESVRPGDIIDYAKARPEVWEVWRLK